MYYTVFFGYRGLRVCVRLHHVMRGEEGQTKLFAAVAQDLPSEHACFRALRWTRFSMCGDLISGKRNPSSKNSETRAFLKVSNRQQH